MLLYPWLMLHDKYFGNFLDSEDWEWEKIAAFMKPSVFQTLLYFVILSNTVELK